MTSEMVIVTLARRLFFRSERREMARFTVVLSFDVLNFRPRRASSFLPMAFSFFCLVFWEENYVQFGNRKKMLTGIAKENGVILQLEISSSEIRKEKVMEKKKFGKKISFFKSKKYKDATQDAFEAEAYVSAAAKTSTELTRSESFASDDSDSDSNGNELCYSAKDYNTLEVQQVNVRK